MKRIYYICKACKYLFTEIKNNSCPYCGSADWEEIDENRFIKEARQHCINFIFEIRKAHEMAKDSKLVFKEH